MEENNGIATYYGLLAKFVRSRWLDIGVVLGQDKGFSMWLSGKSFLRDTARSPDAPSCPLG